MAMRIMIRVIFGRVNVKMIVIIIIRKIVRMIVRMPEKILIRS